VKRESQLPHAGKKMEAGRGKVSGKTRIQTQAVLPQTVLNHYKLQGNCKIIKYSILTEVLSDMPFSSHNNPEPQTGQRYLALLNR
jgi:hypothetical protein